MALSLRAMPLNTTLRLEVACTTVSVEHAIVLLYLVGDESAMPVRIQEVIGVSALVYGER